MTERKNIRSIFIIAGDAVVNAAEIERVSQEGDVFMRHGPPHEPESAYRLNLAVCWLQAVDLLKESGEDLVICAGVYRSGEPNVVTSLKKYLSGIASRFAFDLGD